MKRLVSLLFLLILGISLTITIDRLYCQNELARHNRELGVFAERFQRLVLHSLTDLTVVGDLRAFMLARDTLPMEEDFTRYATEAKTFYQTVSLFAYKDESGRLQYTFPLIVNDAVLASDGQAINKAIRERKPILTSPRHIEGRLSAVALDPLYRGERYLGLTEVYFDIDTILEQAFENVSVGERPFFVRIAGSNGEVFWEKGTNLDGKDNLVNEITITVGDTYWTATIGWEQFPQPNILVRVLIWAGGGLVTILLMIIVREVWARQTWLSKQVAEKTAELVFKNKAILEAKEAQARAERLSSLATMAAGISHEINQPLNSIKILSSGIIYQIRAGEYLHPEEIGRVVQGISGQADRISSIITHMRSFVRRDDSLMVPSDINKTVDQALNIIGTQIANHGICLCKEFSEGLPAILFSPTAMEEVVVNLAVNAMQALDKADQDEKNITICTRLDGGVILEVSDNGPGIDKEILGKIFDPFFSTKESSDNLGLGLSIVHSIISSIGGTIEVVSGNESTTFRIRIPVDQIDKMR